MSRKISFSLTTAQFLAKTKTVTRRIGWRNLKPGDILDGCEKAMGLKRGEKVVVLGQIRIISADPVILSEITPADVIAEGFPNLTPAEFVAMFCATHPKCTPDTEVNRIEFEYI